MAGTWTEKKNVARWIFLFRHMILCTLRIQNTKVRWWEGFEKMEFSSLFLMRKRLSSGQKWFLRPHFPLIGGIFVFRSGPRFSFRAPRVRKRQFSLTKSLPNVSVSEWNGMDVHIFRSTRTSELLILIIGSNIDILRQLWPLTANYLAMFIVTSATIYK